MREKIKMLRHDMGGIDAARDEDRSLEKQIKILEDRLEKAYRSYSEVRPDSDGASDVDSVAESDKESQIAREDRQLSTRAIDAREH